MAQAKFRFSPECTSILIGKPEDSLDYRRYTLYEFGTEYVYVEVGHYHLPTDRALAPHTKFNTPIGTAEYEINALMELGWTVVS